MGGSIDGSTGVVSSTVSAGVITITATLTENARYKAGSVTKNVTVLSKPAQGSGSINTSVASASFDAGSTPQIPSNTGTPLDLKTVLTGADLTKMTSLVAGTTGSDQTARRGQDYQFYSDSAGSNAALLSAVESGLKAGNSMYIRGLSSATADRSIKFTFGFANSADGKYRRVDHVIFLRTQ